MLPGKFVGVVVDFESIQEMLGKVEEGYLKLSWRDENGLKTGYIILSHRKIVGALVEDVITHEILEGEDALREILTITQSGKIRVAEIYKASLNEIIIEKPNIRVNANKNRKKIPGRDIEKLLHILTTHKGELTVRNNGTSWRLYIEDGIVKAAEIIEGPQIKGTPAINLLLRNMGNILRNGIYEVGSSSGFSPSPEKKVSNGRAFINGIELLNEKVKIERNMKL